LASAAISAGVLESYGTTEVAPFPNISGTTRFVPPEGLGPDRVRALPNVSARVNSRASGVRPRTNSCGVASSTLPSELHVKQAQARQMIFFQQTLVNILLLQLVDLRPGHFAAIGSEVTLGFGADADYLLIRS